MASVKSNARDVILMIENNINICAEFSHNILVDASQKRCEIYNNSNI